jgi:hypothetical protein
MADDSGCWCPSPYEAVASIEDLTQIHRLQDFIDRLDARAKQQSPYDGDGAAARASPVQEYRAWKAALV